MIRIFSGGVDFSRINPVGIVLMAVAVLGVLFAHRLSGKIPAKDAQRTENTIKIISLIICAGGALLAILA